MEKIKLFCVSLGCDKNLVDTEKMLGVAGGLGVSFTDDETEADAILINTCCFIGDAKEESVNTILEMARYKEEGKCRALIVAGCLAQRYKQEIIDEIPEVDAILGTTSYEEIGNVLTRLFGEEKEKKEEHISCFHDLKELPETAKKRVMTTGGHYAFLKIAEGCDKRCSYCIIPYARGRVRSRKIAHVMDEVHALASKGYKEVVLTGIHLSSYLTNVREAIFNAIPMNLKHAVSVGIGLFIAFIGLQNAKIVVNNDSTLVSVFSFKSSVSGGTFNTEGITVLLALIGLLITAILLVKSVKGNILWGILITWGLGIICQLTGLYKPDPAAGWFSLLPDFSNGISIPSMAPTFMKMDFSIVFTLDFVVIMFAFLFVDMFDTLGTLIGVASKADMLDKEGKLPNIKGALLSDAVGTTVGAMCGTSTVTTFVESASGVAEGGRTGLTSLVAAILFGLSLLLSPIFLAIPSFATAPALIIVGFLMLTSVTKIDFNDMTEAIPAFIAIIAMPFLYSISEGISMGVISYVIINVVTGKAKEKKISVLMYVLAVLFILKYIFI